MKALGVDLFQLAVGESGCTKDLLLVCLPGFPKGCGVVVFFHVIFVLMFDMMRVERVSVVL